MNYLSELIEALRVLDPTPLVPFVRDVRMRGGALWLAGNGGSFAVAQHWACDLSKVCAVRAQVLGVNGASLTAWANDEEYEHALANELRRFKRADDALIALSCSGQSRNIWRTLAYALSCRIPTVLLTGTINAEVEWANITIRIPSRDYGVIEDCFSAIGHWLTKELVQ